MDCKLQILYIFGLSAQYLKLNIILRLSGQYLKYYIQGPETGSCGQYINIYSDWQPDAQNIDDCER